jgi:hypothetical protein
MAATIGATFMATVWWASVTWEWMHGERLSWTGFGLWFWFAFTNVTIGRSHPFER